MITKFHATVGMALMATASVSLNEARADVAGLEEPDASATVDRPLGFADAIALRSLRPATESVQIPAPTLLTGRSEAEGSLESVDLSIAPTSLALSERLSIASFAPFVEQIYGCRTLATSDTTPFDLREVQSVVSAPLPKSAVMGVVLLGGVVLLARRRRKPLA